MPMQGNSVEGIKFLEPVLKVLEDLETEGDELRY